MDTVLKVTEDEKVKVLKYFNTNENNIKRDVEILKAWFKQEPHLPQNVEDDEFFEHILLTNKCRLEQAKQQIDAYFTLRGLYKEFYSGFEDITPSTSNGVFLPLPCMTKNQERLIYTALKSSDMSIYNFMEYAKTLILMFECLLRHDYTTGYKVLIDFSNVKLEHLLRIHPSVFTTFQTICTKAFSSRIISLDILFMPSYLNVFLKLMKTLMKDKIFKRIRVHDKTESITKFIPANLLPRELYGTNSSLDELFEQWDMAVQEQRKIFKERLNQVSDESKRINGIKYQNEMFGLDGSFKKLDID